jgi:hypothetical protein
VTLDLDKVRHPEYLRMEKRWRMAWDFWRGGIHVLHPEYDVYETYSAQPVTESTEPSGGGVKAELGRTLSNYRWVPDKQKSYLWKHEREIPADFEERQERSYRWPVFPYCINIFSAGILKLPPHRESNEDWEAFRDDVDLAGTDIDQFNRQALSKGLALGRIHAVVDRPPDNGSVSALEQSVTGQRAYVQLYSPLDVVDWEIDKFGEFVWVRLREDDTSDESVRDPVKDEPLGRHSQYRIMHRDRWELWRTPRPEQDRTSEKKEWFLADSGAIPGGRVPIATFRASKDTRPGDMSNESPLSDVLDADRDILNDLSEINVLDRKQGFAVLAIPSGATGGVGALALGPNSALEFPADAGVPQFISPDADITQGRWERTLSKVFSVRQMAGVGRGRAEYSKEERSAESLTIESEDKRNQMVWWAGQLAEFDQRIHEHVSAWEGGAWGDPAPAEYNRAFDFQSIASQIANMVTLGAQEVVSRSAKAEVAKPVVRRILTESGVDEAVVSEVLKSIDTEAEKEPVMPAVFGGAQDEDENRDDDADDS